jgi:dTDP-4-amino-4,6-dideoxygalactose transaminase
VNRVLDASNFILGKEVEEFEQRFAAYCDTRHAVGLNSGTDALFLTLKALGIGKGDEVITAPNSFFASAATIALTGARPVLVDVGRDMNIDPDLIKERITKRTRALMPVHLTGKPARMDAICRIARKNNLALVEDAAQAIGAVYKGKKAGSFGIGCFSLHPLKNLSACGDGGVVVCQNAELAQKLKLLRNHGLRDRDHVEQWGYNSRLDTLQAAISLVKLKRVEKAIAAKRRIARTYNRELREHALYVPEEQPGERQVYQNYIIQLEKRDQVMDYLAKKGIDTKIHYLCPIHLQKPARAIGYRKGDFPVTERLVKTILALPSSAYLKDDELYYTIEHIVKFYRK